jgi:multiple sugar transport system substrate-binding protein
VAASGRTGIRGRRAFVAAVLGLAPTATACGGGSGSGDGGGDGGAVDLRFYWWGSNERHEYTQQLIDRFEAANPGIQVEPEYTGWDEYWDRLATTTAGGDTPDVLQQETRYVREYADRGALLEMDEHIPGVLDTADLDPSVLPTGQVDGVTYAIPTGINARTVVIDPQAFAQAGVPLPDDSTWTWEQMVDVAAQITAATGGQVYGMEDIAFIDTNFEIYARQRGQALYTENGELGFDRQTLVDFWNLAVRARDSGATPPPSVSVEAEAGGIDTALLSTNRAAIGFWWTNELSALSANAGRELQLMRFPGESDQQQAGMYYKPAMYWSIGANTEHPEEAARFVDFLVNAPEAAELLLSDRGLPVNTQLRGQIVDRLEPLDQQVAAFLEEIGPGLQVSPPVPPPGAGEVQQIIQQLHEQVLFDQLTVEQAADQFMEQVRSAIA